MKRVDFRKSERAPHRKDKRICEQTLINEFFLSQLDVIGRQLDIIAGSAASVSGTSANKSASKRSGTVV